MDIAPHERPGNEAPKSRIGKCAELNKIHYKKKLDKPKVHHKQHVDDVETVLKKCLKFVMLENLLESQISRNMRGIKESSIAK